MKYEGAGGLIVALVKTPIYPMLVSSPIVCFVGALLTDIIYWQTAEMMWANFSVWLITFGLILSGLATLVALLDFLRNRAIRALSAAWLDLLGNLLVLLLSLCNVLVHSRDAWTSVVPTGLILSTLVALVALWTGWTGLALIYRQAADAQTKGVFE